MTDAPAEHPRPLIVLSRDPGAIGFASHFVRGQALAADTVVAVPCDPSLFPAWTALPVPGFPYATADDLLRLVDAHRANVVLLFSAYLFAQDGLLSPESLHALIATLRERGCQVATSDPFLGMGRHLTLSNIDTRMIAPGQTGLRSRLVRLAFRLAPGRTLALKTPNLDDVPHVYPAAIPERSDGVQRMAFFNASVIRSADEPAGNDRPSGDDAPSRPPRWLFVLSNADLHVQRVLVGVREFIEWLLGMLRHALEAERYPTMIAPPLVVEQLQAALGDTAEVLPYCPYAEFERRLLDAEYVFCWSPFSFAHMVRVANDLPVFLFERGHLSRTIKPYYDLARACYLGGSEPSFLDQRQIFSPYVLAHLARGQKEDRRTLRERWLSAPTPDGLVQGLLRGGPKPLKAAGDGG